MYTAKLTIMLRYFLLSFTLLTYLFIPAHAAETIDGWVESENIEIVWSNPARSRRSPDATVDVKFINTSSDAIAGPLRFVIQSLTPDTVSLTNADGTMGDYQYFTLIAADDELVAGASVNITKMAIADGGKNIFQMSGSVFEIPVETALSVDFTSPETLKTVGYSPYPVLGTINNASAELTLNGVPVTHQNGEFSAQVELTEGFNTVVARATTAEGEQVTGSIVLSLDLTPPYLTVESHTEAQTVYTDKITVTGLVNDIVRGTVESEQALVQVNGVTASVSNRSYAAHNIPLTEGENTLTISGVDQVGNSASIVRKVIYKVISGSKLVLVSGQNQQAEVGLPLDEELKVKLVDNQGIGIANETVIFRVIQGAGQVGVNTPNVGRAVIVTTDDDGFAQTAFQLGYRSGIANHKVKAKVVGYENEVIFNHTALSAIASDIGINSGNNQRGTIGQALPAPLVIIVTDSEGNAVKGTQVRFATSVGEGTFQNEQSTIEATTDSDGRASAEFVLGTLEGIDAQRVVVTLPGMPEDDALFAVFSATAFTAGEAGNTSVSGVVVDNQDNPIPGVTVRIENTNRLAISDEQGQFTIVQAPVGPIHIIADGSTATIEGEFPALGYHLVTVAGVKNPMTAPIYMVKLDTENGVLAGSEDVVLTLEDYPGFKLEIAKDSVTFPNGEREGIISITPVNSSKVPMTPPNGMQFPFVVTIQPVGSVFSPPAKLTMPNVGDNTPGGQVEMYSFDHDLEEFVAIGLGTVSEDGTLISSNAGVGVIKAGWHASPPPPPPPTKRKRKKRCTYKSKKCYTCVFPCKLERDLRPFGVQTSGDCKSNICGGDTTPNPLDVPKEVGKYIGDCKKPGCSGANNDTPNLAFENDDTDITENDKKCATCSDGKKIEDPDKAGDKCGDGSLQECYTCKGGSCGNHCDASDATTKVAFAGPSGFTKFLEKTVFSLNKIPNVVANFGGVSTSGYTITGEHCCTDCSKGELPAEYKVRGGELAGAGKVTMAFAGIATRFGPFWFGEFRASGEFILAPLAGEASLSLSAKGESEKISTCDEASCTELSIKSEVNFAIGSIGNVSGKLEYCSSVGTCEADLFSVNGQASATANVSLSVQGNTFLGESCPSGDVSASLGKITLLVKALISGSFGIVSFEEEVKKELVIYEG